MKKLLCLFLVLFTLVGCGKGYSQLSDGNEVLFKGPDNYTYTKNDLYRSLKLASAEPVELDILNKISQIEQLDLTQLEQEAQQMADLYISYGLQEYLVSSYGSIDAFIKSYVSDGLLTEFAKFYVENNFDQLIEEDKPVKMQITYFKNKDAASKLVEDVNNGSSFDIAAYNNGFETDLTASVYTDTDEDLDYYVKEYLNSTDATGISTVIDSVVTNQDTDGNAQLDHTYYVLNVIDRDVNNFKDDYIAYRASVTEENTVKTYLYTKHDIKFYDQDIYEIMKEQNSVFE